MLHLSMYNLSEVELTTALLLAPKNTCPEHDTKQEIAMPAGSLLSPSVSLTLASFTLLLWQFAPSMLDKQTLLTKVTPLCLFSLSTPQSVFADTVIK